MTLSTFLLPCSSSLPSWWRTRGLGNSPSHPGWFFWRFRAAGGTSSRPVLQAGHTDLLHLNVGNHLQLPQCLNVSLLLFTSRTLNLLMSISLHHGQHCCGSNLDSLLQTTGPAQDGSAHQGCLTQQDLNTTKARLSSKKRSLGRKSRDST